MYKITTVEGHLITQTDDPRFVKLNTESGAWIRTDAINAECIAVNGVRYSLAGREPVEDAPIVAFIQKIDAGAVQLETDNKVTAQNDSIDTLAWAINKMAEEIVDKFSFKTEEG